MTNFKRYFKYHLRSNLIRMVITLSISLVYIVPICLSPKKDIFDGLGKSIIILGFLATVIPIFEFCHFSHLFGIISPKS